MSNKYANLDGSKKIREEYTKINAGFDAVEADINAVNGRVDTIITTPIDGEAAAQEVVDARSGFSTIGARMTNIETDLISHKADTASETKKGHVELATVEETLTGTDTTRAVHPAGAKALLSTASAKNILHNHDWRNPVNQRGLTSYSNVMYTIDRWLWTVAVPTRSVTIQSGYVTITNNAGTTGIFGQKLEALEPGTYTLSVLFTDGTVENKTLTWDGLTLTEQSTSFGTLSLRRVDGFPTFAMGIGASKTINVKAVKLEKSQASTLVNDPVADYGEQLLLCKRYYRLWSTEEARTGALKEAGLMRLVSPTVGTIDIGGSTYYFASAEL